MMSNSLKENAGNNIVDGRKKMFEVVEIMADSSIDSCECREVLKMCDYEASKIESRLIKIEEKSIVI